MMSFDITLPVLPTNYNQNFLLFATLQFIKCERSELETLSEISFSKVEGLTFCCWLISLHEVEQRQNDEL